MNAPPSLVAAEAASDAALLGAAPPVLRSRGCQSTVSAGIDATLADALLADDPNADDDDLLVVVVVVVAVVVVVVVAVDEDALPPRAVKVMRGV